VNYFLRYDVEEYDEKEMTMNSSSTYIKELWLPTLAMIIIVVVSNIVVQIPINDWLTWGALTYPVCFLVTDLTNRRYGPAKTRLVVYAGFALAVILSIWFAGARIAVASGTAFLLAQLVDVYIFNRLRRLTWWQTPLISSTLASALDTALFFSIAFYATPVPWVTLGIGDFGVKLVLALAMLIPFRALMHYVAPAEAKS
jgi:queuosine precursor transporter